ncbi:AhpC/TSA family protein [Dokdonia sinensis]|uniref:AhpC/TSA family protein n=1 Tax=Dokdonia sinensis TaxID=2479847 RepID=A0A3M0FVD8_9FLAO|nr:peroxiredoxin-like family protein [Dokdonia sinensis]RMB56654.1 AhpC/TSA family protein [Dokdonia sinensis]
MILPRTKVPSLELDLINDTKWKLADQTPENFTLIVFYRGLHCPVCKKQLEELAGKLDKFTERGTNVIAVSADSEDRAKKAGEDWNIPSLPIGYELSFEKAKEYGLHISEGVNDKEPEYFTEPGIFLVRPDGELYFSSVQSMPFARPQFDDILGAIDYVLKNDYPARGELKEVAVEA